MVLAEVQHMLDTGTYTNFTKEFSCHRRQRCCRTPIITEEEDEEDQDTGDQNLEGNSEGETHEEGGNKRTTSPEI